MYSVGNILTTVIALHGNTEFLDILWLSFLRYVNVESLCCTCETIVILYVKSTSVKKIRI